MIRRIIEEKVKRFSEIYPVVTITGPRQSGKTTLVQHLFKEHEYFSLEDPDVRRRVIEDPAILFYPAGRKIIIDEVQRWPELLSYIQVNADRQEINGQFILTGSQSLLLSEKVSQTLAGRTAILKLLPFSLTEIFNHEHYAKDEYEQWIHRGFYPRLYQTGMNPDEFYPSYFETYLQRDVRDIQHVKDLNQFSNFVRLCAGRIGQLVDFTSLASDAGVSVNTARGWISLLEASYVIFLLYPYYKNYNRRIIKSPKLFFTDTGLACFLLNIAKPEQVSNHYLRGNLFENLIISELLKKRFNQAMLPGLWFFRDSNGNEVDCILEDATIKALEVKSSRTYSTNYHTGLERFIKLSDLNPGNCYVIYGGNENFKLKDINILSWKYLETLT